MKSSVGVSGFGVLVTFLILCIFLVINQQAEAQLLEKTYLGDDAIRIKTNQGNPLVDIQLTENTDHCLVDCHAILKIHPYQDIILPDGPNAEFDWKFVKEKPWMDGLASHHFEILEKTEYKVEVPEYEKRLVSTTCYNKDNTTYKCEMEQTVQTDLHQETRYIDEYKPFSFWGETLKANQDYTIKLVGKKHLVLGKNNIDWIATIKGIELSEWQPWNGDWQYKQQINITSQTQNMLNYTVNITTNSTTNGTHFNWSSECGNKFRFVNSDETAEFPYYTKTCDAENQYLNVYVKTDISTITTPIWIYYGNVNATDGQDIANAALFIDLMNTDRTNEYTALNLNADYSDRCPLQYLGDKYRILCTANPQGRAFWSITALGTNNTNISMCADVAFNDTNPSWAGFITNSNGTTAFGPSYYKAGNVLYFVNYDEPTFGLNSTALHFSDYPVNIIKNSSVNFPIVPNTFYELCLHIAPPNATATLNGTIRMTAWNFTERNTGAVGLSFGHTTNSNWLIKNLLVRNYTFPEPTYSIGNEIPFDTTPPNTTIPIIKPDPAYTTDELLCNATLTDDKATSLTAYWKWYKNGLEYLSGSTNVNNGTNTLVTSLSSGNTSKGESWFCEVTPYDGNNYGSAKNSSSLTIVNSPPTHLNPILISTSGKNFTSDNLACYNQSTSDPDSDPVANIYNWYKNNQPFAVLNMPFENSAKDYSGRGNNGILKPNATDGPQFTTGKIGKALLFDGKDDYVDLGTGASLKPQNGTYEAWVKINALPTDANVGGVIFENYQYYNGLFFSIRNTGKLHIRPHNGAAACTLDSVSALNAGEWYHVAGTIKGTNVSLYINGVFNGSATCNYLLPPLNAISRIGSWGSIFFFNGTIDEVKIYPYALSQEQIRQNYLDAKDGYTDSRMIVSQETNPGETYRCEITPNDGFDDGTALNSSLLTVVWNITFNIIDGEDGNQLTNVNIYCNNSWSITGVNSPYATGFLPEGYSCTFERDFYFNKTVTFIADSDKIVNVVMSKSGFLSVEEHHWLEALYNCLINGNCEAFEMWKSTNQTVFDIWKRVTRTNREVVIQENIISNTLSNTSNITINYTINIPFKEGYSNGELLPLRMFFWFHDGNKCYNQDKRTDSNRAESPYCFPLIAETLGPNNRTVSFTVDLRPNLPSGTYNITRTIEIDPLFEGVIRWTNYGQEVIGQINVLESGDMTTKLTKIEEKYSSDEVGFQPSITGNVIETTKEFFTNTQVFILLLAGMSCITIILHSYFKCKKKN